MKTKGEIVRVAIADAKTAKNPDQLFTVVGSCIAIMLFDKINKIGGMIHIMLGYSKGRDDNICKYVDTGVPFLLQMLQKNGAVRRRIQGAKIAGGAILLGKSDDFNIAEENLSATHGVLRKHGIQVIASDCGGNLSRRISFDLSTGKVRVESQNGYFKIL